MSYRRKRGYGAGGFIYDIVRLFFDENYDPNKRHNKRMRRTGGYDTLSTTVRETAQESAMNARLQNALVEQMYEDKVRKERYDELMNERRQAQANAYKFNDDDDPKMDSL